MDTLASVQINTVFHLWMCTSSFCMLIQSIAYSIFIMSVVFPQDTPTCFVSEWSPCTFMNLLASNHVIKLVNTGTSTCHSTLDS